MVFLPDDDADHGDEEDDDGEDDDGPKTKVNTTLARQTVTQG